MIKFKANLLNNLSLVVLLLILSLGYFLVWIIRISGWAYFLTNWTTYLLILCLAYFVYLFLLSIQTIYFTDKKLILSGIFSKTEIEFLEIKNIEQRILIQGLDFFLIGIKINNKNLTKTVIILKYNFLKNWDEILKLIQEKSKKKIRD